MADLSRLHGPTHGLVELPHRLFWQPDRRVNLDNPAVLTWMYETVLREAVTEQELCTWLDGPTLLRLWDGLYLLHSVRAASEKRHPRLSRRTAA